MLFPSVVNGDLWCLARPSMRWFRTDSTRPVCRATYKYDALFLSHGLGCHGVRDSHLLWFYGAVFGGNRTPTLTA